MYHRANTSFCTGCRRLVVLVVGVAHIGVFPTTVAAKAC